MRPRAGRCDKIRPAHPLPHSTREKTRPTPPLHPCCREKVRPARNKTPIVGHFEHAGRTFSRSHPPSDQAGRTFSRTGHSHVAAVKPPSPMLAPEQQPLKPMTPLQPLMQASMKPPSPMLAPEQQPLKPPSPLQPKNAPKTPISHPQRQWRFHLRLTLPEQRRRRFHARDFRCTRAMASPDQRTFACNSTADTSRVSMQSLKFRAF